MHRHTHTTPGWWALAVMAGAALACSIVNPSPTTQGEQPGTENEEQGTEVEEQAADGESEALELLAPVPGGATITLTTPSQGAGAKPLLAWEPVSGAASYGLVVYDAAGHSYWAWQGVETSVYLGGAHEAPSPDSAGPILQAGMSWGVMAFDADGRLTASSARVPISP